MDFHWLSWRFRHLSHTGPQHQDQAQVHIIRIWAPCLAKSVSWSTCFPGCQDRLFLHLKDALLQDLTAFLLSFAIQSCLPWDPTDHFLNQPKSDEVQGAKPCYLLSSLPSGCWTPLFHVTCRHLHWCLNMKLICTHRVRNYLWVFFFLFSFFLKSCS